MPKPIRVLLIEDDPSYGELATELLELCGYVVARARDAEEGLRLAPAARPAVILLDIHLPGMDGFEAMRALRNDPGTRSIPVVGMTADRLEDEEERAAQAAGFRAYIEKPVRAEAFREIVQLLVPPPLPSGQDVSRMGSSTPELSP